MGDREDYKEDCKRKAAYALEQMRRGTIGYRFALWCITENLREGRWFLFEIGTRPAELNKLRIEDCKKSVQSWIDALQFGFFAEPDEAIKYIRNRLGKSGLSLFDAVNINEEKLEEFRVKAWEMVARNGVDIFEKQKCPLTACSILKAAERGGFPLSNIGVDEKELEKVLSEYR